MAVKQALLELKFKFGKADIQRAIKAMTLLGVEIARLEKTSSGLTSTNKVQIQNRKQEIASIAEKIRKTREEISANEGLTATYSEFTEQTRERIRLASEEAQFAAEGRKRVEALTAAFRERGALVVEEARLRNSIEATTDSLGEQLTTQQQLSAISRQQRAGSSVEMGLMGARSLTRMAGMGGVSQGLMVAGEMASLTRELPLLKASLGGMPAAIKNAASALGPAGIGLAAVLGVLAIAAMAAANATREAYEAVRESEQARIKAREELIGLTSEEVRQLRESEQANIAFLQSEEERLAAMVATANDEQIFNMFDHLRKEAGLAFGEISGWEDELDTVRDRLFDAVNSQRTYGESLMDGEQAAVDAAAAHEAYLIALNETTFALLSGIQQRMQAEQRAMAASVDANNARLDAIADERLILEAQIATITELDTVTPELTEELERLRGAMSALDTEAEFITNTALGAAKALEAETAQREYAEQQRDETLASIRAFNDDVAALDEERLEIEKQYQEAMVDAARKAAEAAEKALDKLNETSAKLQKELARSGVDLTEKVRLKDLDVEIKAQRKEAKALRDHHRKLEKIRVDAQRKEEDLELDRDFRAIFQLRKETSRKMEDASTGLVASQQERQIAAQQQLDDIRTAATRERAQRLVKFQRDLSDAQAQYQKELAIADQKRAEMLLRAAQELTLQRAANAQQLALRQQALQQELQIISMGLAQRNAYILEGERALLLQARNFVVQAMGSFGGYQTQARYGSVTATARPTTRGTVRASRARPGAGSRPVNITVIEADKPEQTAELVYRQVDAIFGDN